MNPKFIRTFADDLHMLMKGPSWTEKNMIISDTVIKLHEIARLIEEEEQRDRESSEDSRK